MQYEHLNVVPMAGCLGAEISGVDLRSTDEAAFSEIMQAFMQYKAIFFRNQNLTPEQYIAFSQHFGPAQIDKFIAAHPDYPELMQLLKEARNKGRNFGGSWHSNTFYLEQPPIGVSLYAHEVPPFDGDTIWVDMDAVYKALSDTYKQMLSPLKAEHLTTGKISKQDLSKEHYGRYFNDEYQELSINTAQADLGNNEALILNNHGLLTAGRDVAEAFSAMYYLEKSCQSQLQAMTANANYLGYMQIDWQALVAELDLTQPDYKN